MGETKFTMQEIFRTHYAGYCEGRRLPLKYHRAAEAIMRCRSEAMGGHVQQCPQGHMERVQYHSCRHRSCPRCTQAAKARWADAQFERLLECDHFHVVFTLPHELLTLWSWNRRWFVDALFAASRETLMELLGDERYLGATPGILMTLHTWTRRMARHPHTHNLVTAGGVTPSGEWKPVRNGFLLPVRVVKAKYRGKLLSWLWKALDAGELQVPPDTSDAGVRRLLGDLKRKPWSVRVKERYSHGRGVMLYLSRYVKGGAISERRLISSDGREVVFGYNDLRDGKYKTERLPIDSFIGRVLWHVPEPGQHVVRHCGLYGHRSYEQRAVCRRSLGQAPERKPDRRPTWQAQLDRAGQAARTQCGYCGSRLVRGRAIPARWTRYQNSLYRLSAQQFVQQDVGTDRGGTPRPHHTRADIFSARPRPFN